MINTYVLVTSGETIEVQQAPGEEPHTVLEIDGQLRCVRLLESRADDNQN